jgi:hypothetical protein
MILKIFRGVWFISLLAVMANLMWVYAGLPEEVVLMEEGGGARSLGREALFYSWLAIIGLLNVLVYVFSKSLTPDEIFRTWFTGLIIALNVFLVIALSYIALFNSSEKFDFSRAGIVVYFGVLLVGGWLVSWPVILFVRKLSA